MTSVVSVLHNYYMEGTNFHVEANFCMKNLQIMSLKADLRDKINYFQITKWKWFKGYIYQQEAPPHPHIYADTTKQQQHRQH